MMDAAPDALAPTEKVGAAELARVEEEITAVKMELAEEEEKARRARSEWKLAVKEELEKKELGIKKELEEDGNKGDEWLVEQIQKLLKKRIKEIKEEQDILLEIAVRVCQFACVCVCGVYRRFYMHAVRAVSTAVFTCTRYPCFLSTRAVSTAIFHARMHRL